VKAWLKGLVAAIGLFGSSHSALAVTPNYSVYTSPAGDIYLKAPEQFVLIHADVSVPLFVMPADGYLKIMQNADGTWSTVAITAAEWNSLGLYQGGNTVERLQYADMNGDGSVDMFLSLRGGSFLILYRQKDGKFITSASPAGVVLGASYELTDENGDGLLDVVSGGVVVSYGLPTFQTLYSGKPASSQQANHVGMTAGSFRVDESGQVSYSIPLTVPAGIAGVQPQVALNYNSGAGLGLAGMGWSLSGSSMISRCAKTIEQDGLNQTPQFNANDAYCLDGQRLVLTDGSYGAANSKYRLELDDFSRIEITAADSFGPSAFKLINKANETHIFGTDSSLQLAPGKNIAAAWAISSISDSFNNAINFSYFQSGVDGKSPGNFLLKEISYAGGSAKVVPVYQTTKSPKAIYMNGQEVVFKYRLDYVKVLADINRSEYTHRFYHLGYQDNQFSYLNTVQECLAAGEQITLPSGQTDTPGSQCKKELRFEYAELADYSISSIAATTPYIQSGTPAGTSFADVSGDGILDYIYVSSDGKTLSSHIANSTALVKTITTSLNTTVSNNFKLADITGDGFADIIYAVNDKWFYKTYGPVTYSGSCNSNNSEVCHALIGRVKSDYSGEKSTSVSSSTPAQFGDVNGDGLLDWMVVNERKVSAYLNEGGKFAAEAVLLNEFSSALWPAPKPTTAKELSYKIEFNEKSDLDVNGDGNSDLLVNLITKYQYVTGYNDRTGLPIWGNGSEYSSAILKNTGSKPATYIAEVIPGSFIYEPLFLDLNGDGLADIITTASGSSGGPSWIVYYATGAGNVSYLSPQAINRSQKINNNKKLFNFGDFNGDGIVDLVEPITVNNSAGLVKSYLGLHLGAFDSASGKWGLTDQVIELPVQDTKNVLNNTNTSVQWSDADADGDIDLFFNRGNGWQVYLSHAVNNKPAHKITRIRNGFGASTTIEYANATDRTVYQPSQPVISDGSVNSDYLAPQSGMQLVKKVSTDTRWSDKQVTTYDPRTGQPYQTTQTSADQVSVSYSYSGFLLHKKGRGSLGFRELSTVDNQTGIKTTTSYNQSWPFIGRPVQTIVTTADGKEISRATTTWATKKVADGGDFVYLQASTEKGSQITSAGTVVPIKKVATTNEYDASLTGDTAWGNLTKTTVNHYGYVGSGNTETLLLTTTTSNSYDGWSVANSKRFGRLSRADVKQTQTAVAGLQSASEQTRSSQFTYQAQNGVLETEEIGNECLTIQAKALSARAATDACDPTNWKKTTYSYNEAGLKTQTKVETKYGSRFESVKYSSNNRFVLAKSDGVLDDTSANIETYLYNGSDNPAGRIYETVVTGPNKLLSLTRFNEWGDAVESVDATGITTYNWLENCADSASLKSYCGEFDEFISRTKRAGTPEQAEITDKFGRVSKKLAVGFDGFWKQTAVSFDAQGRLEKEYQAEAVTSGLPTSKYTSYSYDGYSRLVKTTHADASTVEVKYLGLTTSAKDEEGYWRDEVTDALGRTVFTSDPYSGTKPAVLGGVKQSYDAFGNNVRTEVLALVDSGSQLAVGNNGVNTAIKVTETASFDRYGRRLSSSSLSKGTWYYGYNGFGELVSQQNGRGELVNNSYDRLGRLLESNSNDGKVCYTYGTELAKRNIGKLTEVRRFAKDTACDSTATPDYRESYLFDLLGRPAATESLQNAKLFQQMAFYDDYGRMYQQLLPGGVTVQQVFNSAGFQYQTQANGTVISEIKEMDAAGRVVKASFVGGSSRSVKYTPERGFIENITVQGSGSQTLYTVDYGYTLRGDTKSRQSNYFNSGSSSLINETYTYSTDGHFRLEKRDVAVTSPAALGNLVTSMSQSFSYDSLGNFKTKAGVGSYEYDSTNPYLLRRTTGASSGVRSYVMSAADYDVHGNIKADGQRSFSYNQADMVTSIAKGADSTRFVYAPDNSRIYREDNRNNVISKTWYLGKIYEFSQKGNDTEQRWYIGNVVITEASKVAGLRYEVLHGDAQGSAVTVTDGAGQLMSHSLYDAWGQQSVLQVGSTSQLFVQSLQRRAYTGHENIEGLGIIHMNGRIYDPLLARFVQADPTLQFAQYSQGYNRYSYVLNNPMTYTDPSGYFVKWMMKKTGTWDLLQFIASVPILDAIVTVALNYIPGCQGWCSAMYVAAFQAAKAYAVTGSLGAGLRAGLLSAAMPGGASFGDSVLNFVADGITGGIFSVLQGGKFGHGFLSSSVGNAMAGAGGANPYNRVIVSAITGGTISALTGGKFANGAATAALVTAIKTDWGHTEAKLEEEHADPDPTSIKDWVTKNKKLDLKVSEDGKTLSGSVSIYCSGADMQACSAAATAMASINQTIDGMTIALDVAATRWRTFADLEVSWRVFDDPDTTGQQYMNKIEFKHGVGFGHGKHPLTPAHELGHFLGLDHQWNNTQSLMSYSSSRTNYLTPIQMKNLLEAYK